MIIFRHIIHFLYPSEEFSNRCFVEKRHAEDAKNIKCASIKLEIVLNNSNKAISCNCRENLDSNRIFCYTPERLYMQMLLYPLKKQLHLPPVFIKQGNVFCADVKIISEVSKGSFVFHRIIADTSEQSRIFPFCLLSGKPYYLIVKNIVWAFKKVFTINDFIFKLASFPYYKVGSDEIDCKEPCKIKISTIKNVISIRFVRNFIHGIHVINFGLRDMKKGWDLSHNIKERMYLNASFGLAKVCPPEKIQTQVDSSRIKGLKPPSDFKFFGNSFFLCNGYHFVGKFFKNPTVSAGVRLCQIAAGYQNLTEAQMVRLRGMCCNYANKLSEAITAGKLAIHHYKQLIPAAKRLDIFVTLKFHNDTIKNSLWKILHELTENIFSFVHSNLFNIGCYLQFQINTLIYLIHFSHNKNITAIS